jgi:hypothetical protein
MIRKTPITCEEIVARAQANGDLVECSQCKGEGFIATDSLCPVCGGSGFLLRRRASLVPVVVLFLVLALLGGYIVISRILHGQ